MRRLPTIVGLLSLLLVSLPVSANPPAFRIGVECGPLWGVSDYAGYGVMQPNNPRFYQNHYFYADLRAGGFDYDRIKAFHRNNWDANSSVGTV